MEDAAAHASDSDAPRRPSFVIVPRSGWRMIDLAELWRFRDLGWILTARNVKVRYKQAVLGPAWAVLRPLVEMLVFTVFFGHFMGLADRVEHLEGREIPYAVFVFTGVLLWTLFNEAVNAGSMSLVSEANLLRKVYLPRLLVPLSQVAVPLVDFFVAMLVLAGLMVYYQFGVGPQALLGLVALLITATAATGVSLFLAALTVKYRDFRFVVPFLTRIWFFLTPVLYPIRLVPEQWRWALGLNPMSGAIDYFRAVLLGTSVHTTGLWISAATALLMLLLGAMYFNRVERDFADVA